MIDAHLEQCAITACRAVANQPTLRAAVEKEVDAFFARHPGIDRNLLTESFVASTIIERFSAGADSQSDPAPAEAKNKVA